MSSIKLKHSGGNAVSLNPPSSAPTSSDVAFKLPNADGSAGQFMKTDGSGNLSFATAAAGIPSGVIVMWNSTVASIPTGWVLCDGNNSTPDLRDRFIVGAKQDDSGTAKTNVTGSLTQTGGAATDSISVSGTTAATTSTRNFESWVGSGYSGVNGNHTHTFSGSATVDTIPPYYALCYIMKS